MSRFVRTIFATSGFILLMTACGTVETLPVRVVSLEENLPALSEAAQAWRPDAYLANASLALLDEQAGPLLLQAVFLSPSEQSQGLSVVLMEGGTINAEVVPHTVPVIQVEPIADDDWRLDSTEALERGLDEEGRRYIEEHSTWDCSFLVLERGGREPGSPVVWRLVLTDCLDPLSAQEAILDAMSGEVISREVHTPPTPMPTL